MNQKHSLNIANVFLFFDYHQKLLAVGNIIPRPALLHSYVSARLRLRTRLSATSNAAIKRIPRFMKDGMRQITASRLL